MHYILSCEGPLPICSSGPCHLHHQTKSTAGLRTIQQDLHIHTNITTLLEFCLKIPIPSSRVSILNRSHDTVMGSPISPMYHSSSWKSLNTRPSALYPIPQGCGYMGDTFVIQKAEHRLQLFYNINSIDSHIQLTTEVSHSNGFIPFWTL